MDHAAAIVRIKNGAFSSLETTNPTLLRVAIVEDDQPYRVAAVRQLTLEAEIIRGLETYRACQLSGAWQGLDAARENAGGALRALEPHIELAELLEVPISSKRDPGDLPSQLAQLQELWPRREDAKVALRQTLRRLEELDDAEAAAEQILAEAADGGPHQARRSLIAAE